MSVQSIMTRAVIHASPATTVRDAIRLLEDTEVRHLPVVEDGELVGIVSDRDLREYRVPLYLETEHLTDEDRQRANRALDTPLNEVMSSEVISVEAHESIRSVIDVMIEYEVGAVPVVSADDELIGIVSYIDVLRHARDLFEG